MARQMNTERILNILSVMRVNAEAQIEQFRAKLAVNPAYALEWSDSAYDAAAEIEIAAFLQRIISGREEEGAAEEEIVAMAREVVLERMLEGAGRSHNYSTGQGQNLMDAARTAAYAKLHERLN